MSDFFLGAIVLVVLFVGAVLAVDVLGNLAVQL